MTKDRKEGVIDGRSAMPAGFTCFLFFRLTCRAGKNKAKEPSTLWSMPAGTGDLSSSLAKTHKVEVGKQKGCGLHSAHT